jgi:catechol 2,3-dioxygenase-like lactoylglutathione lyase family enzyme
LDHIAFRVKDRKQTAQFLMDAFGYLVQDEFKINFDDGTSAECIALEPKEKSYKAHPWIWNAVIEGSPQEYHMPPEIFVSDGEPGSIVGNWVEEHGGIGGVHHLAFQVDNVEETMALWKERGWLPFTSDKPQKCPDLVQVFTTPAEIMGGVIIEFIERGEHGFCKDNVKALMTSTKGLK